MNPNQLTLDGYLALEFDLALRVAGMKYQTSEANPYVPPYQDGDYHAPDTIDPSERVMGTLAECGFRDLADVKRVLIKCGALPDVSVEEWVKQRMAEVKKQYAVEKMASLSRCRHKRKLKKLAERKARLEAQLAKVQQQLDGA